ncbi:MAG: right-handed parallel beta-helix repeat-containing protein, partial [Paludibacteraceae bacterium]|nr:right-handed parallel beta-helix repeat-containing protein [Paludibacteraceae bacterium]
MKHFVTFMAACCLTMSMQAANYYCAPEGVGSGNSVDNPCSLRSGVSKLSSPGDTLFLLDGVYYEDSKLSIKKKGSANQSVCIFAYPGAHPVIDFRNQPYGSANRGVSVDSATVYLHLKGLTIRYAGDNGLYFEGSYSTIEQCEFYGNCDTGLQLKRGHDNRIINCDSHDNFDYQTGSTASADFGGNADGFADKQYDNQGGNYFYGCRAWNNSDDGWDFFQHVSHGSQTVLEHCICYNNGPAAYDMTNHPRYQTDYAWFKQFEGSGMDVGDSDSKTGGTKRVTISNYVNWGNGNGFKLGGGMTNHNVQVQ